MSQLKTNDENRNLSLGERMKKANEDWKAMPEGERSAFAKRAQEEEEASMVNGPQDL